MKAASWILGAVLLGTFAFFYRDGGYNQNVRFDLTRAIVERGTLTIDAYHENTLDKAYRAGHYYCDKPPAVSFLGVPAYFAAYQAIRLSDVDPTSPRAQAWSFYVTRLTAISVLAALLGFIFLRTAAHFCRPWWAVVITVGLSLGTMIFPYSTIFYGHQVAGTALFSSFALLFISRRDRTTSPWKIYAAGLAAGVAGAADYPAFLLAGFLGLYLLTGPARRRALGWFVAGAALPTILLMAYHTICFGSPFSPGFAYEALPFWKEKYNAGFFGLSQPRAQALYQLTIGPRRGLFYQAPWLILFAPGLWCLVVERRWRAEAALITAMVGAMVLLNTSLQSWEGGWTMGARYLIPVLPFLAFAAVFAHGRAVRVVAVLLVPLSVFFMLAGAAVMPEVPGSVSDPLGEVLVPSLVTGRLSVADPAGQAFNLGEWLGLHGIWSLVPLLGLWCAGAVGVTVAVQRGDWPRATWPTNRRQ